MANNTYILQDPATGMYMGSIVQHKGKKYHAWFDSIGMAFRYRTVDYAARIAKKHGYYVISLPGGGSDNG